MINRAISSVCKTTKFKNKQCAKLSYFRYSETKENTTINNYPDVVKLFFEKNIKDKKIPCFEVYSSQIEILNQPMDFYLAIIKLIRSAKYRIVLSSLYFGTDKMEEFIVEELVQALKRTPSLKISIILDYSRGMRVEKIKNSVETLERILIEVSVNIKFGIIHTLGTLL